MKAAAVLGLALAVLLVGCGRGTDERPTIELDARAFVQSYLAQRDAFVRQTAPAHKRCETLAPLASDALKAKCARLRVEQETWAARDAVILNALLTRSVVSAESWAAAWAVAKEVLAVAADLAL